MDVLSSTLWRGAVIPHAIEGVQRWRISAAIGLLTWSTVALVPWLMQKGDWIVIAALAVISQMISFGNEWLRRKIPSARPHDLSMILAATGILLVAFLQYRGLMPAWSPD
jgi:hypothetical protein